jgi:D-aminopeptidase
MTNHGKLPDLVINGDPIGRRITDAQNADLPDRGSCIVILATDLPLSDRQIRRVLKRCPVGMARLGSYVGEGSGEIFVGFSVANRFVSDSGPAVTAAERFDDARLDPVFRAAAEATEEAILNAMAEAETVTGYTGFTRHALSEYLGKV